MSTRFSNNFGGDILRENEIAIVALDVELTEEQWRHVQSAAIKEV